MTFAIFAFTSKEQHHATHEWTEENGQERNDCVGIDLARHYEESDETCDGEENEECFS